jgi:hypothetical protein
MLVYPQLETGALSQFPIKRCRRARTVVNAASDGSAVKLPDPAGGITEWTLNYAGLADSELAALEQFFASAEGSLNGFTFLDPAANLFAASDAIGSAAWEQGPLLTVTGGIADPEGGTNAWRITNLGAAAQTITQTLAAPGAYVYCVSAWVRAESAGLVTLLLGSGRADRETQAQWSRITFAGTGDAASNSMLFGIEIPAGASVEVYGMQAEPQAGASKYRASTTGGVYEGARFEDDELAVTTAGGNNHSCRVRIVHVGRRAS